MTLSKNLTNAQWCNAHKTGRGFLFVLNLVAICGLLLGAMGELYAQNNNNNNNNNNSNSGGRSGRSGNNNSGNNDNENDSSYMAFGYRSVVGGFAINTGEALKESNRQEVANLAQKARSEMEAVPAGLDNKSELRKVSLRRLSDLLKKCAATQAIIPDSARYLAGLTAIKYVIVVPEDKDIYLVGPAEGWTMDATGAVVGKATGKPVLLLEDLLTVLRSWNTDKPELISCSIDPTREALQNFANMAKITDPAMKKLANEKAMGLMNVSFSGIPSESRMARILAAADYRMKRLSLGFEEAPVKGLGSYSGMIRGRSTSAFAPRFWIEPGYNTIFHDPDQKVWALSDTSIKTLTEREYFDTYGNRKESSKRDVAAEKWAENMTRCYNALSAKEPVFAEARNCMDIALVAALIYFQNLPQKAGLTFDILAKSDTLQTTRYPAPEKVASSSLVRVMNRKGDFLTVTGGVLINPWTTVQNNIAVKAELASLKTNAQFNDNWWSE